MTIHPVAVRVAEMLMHPEEPMLPQAALDYVREETGLEAGSAYEQIRHALAEWLENRRSDGLSGSLVRSHIQDGNWEQSAVEATKGFRFSHAPWQSWYYTGTRVIEMGKKLQSLVPVEVSQ